GQPSRQQIGQQALPQRGVRRLQQVFDEGALTPEHEAGGQGAGGDRGDGRDRVGHVAARAAERYGHTGPEQIGRTQARDQIGRIGPVSLIQPIGDRIEPGSVMILHGGGRGRVRDDGHYSAATARGASQRNGSSCGFSGGWPRLLAKLQSVARLTPSTTSSALASVNPAARKALSASSLTRPRVAMTALAKAATAARRASAAGRISRSACTVSVSRPAFLVATAVWPATQKPQPCVAAAVICTASRSARLRPARALMPETVR